MKIPAILRVLLLLTLLSTPVGAQVYQWVDENGVKRYSNTPPPEGVENYETTSEAVYDEEADKARTEDDARAVEEYTQMKAQEEELAKQMEEAQARQVEAEKIDAIKAEQQKIEEQLATKTRYIRTRARRQLIRLRNIEKELAGLAATPANADKRAQLEAEKQTVIDGLMQNKRYFQAGGRQLAQDYQELDKALQAYQ